MYENFLKTARPGLAQTRHYHTKTRTLTCAKQLEHSGEQPDPTRVAHRGPQRVNGIALQAPLLMFSGWRVADSISDVELRAEVGGADVARSGGWGVLSMSLGLAHR